MRSFPVAESFILTPSNIFTTVFSSWILGLKYLSIASLFLGITDIESCLPLYDRCTSRERNCSIILIFLVLIAIFLRVERVAGFNSLVVPVYLFDYSFLGMSLLFQFDVEYLCIIARKHQKTSFITRWRLVTDTSMIMITIAILLISS